MSEEKYHAYCVRCKASREIKNPRIRTENGRSLARGECPVCGCKLYYCIRGQ